MLHSHIRGNAHNISVAVPSKAKAISCSGILVNFGKYSTAACFDHDRYDYDHPGKPASLLQPHSPKNAKTHRLKLRCNAALARGAERSIGQFPQAWAGSEIHRASLLGGRTPQILSCRSKRAAQ